MLSLGEGLEAVCSSCQPGGESLGRGGPRTHGARSPGTGGHVPGATLTHVKMEKKEKAMAALAASVPSFSGLSLGLETCHWLAKKQKPTNHRKAQKATVHKARDVRHGGGGKGREGRRKPKNGGI